MTTRDPESIPSPDLAPLTPTQGREEIEKFVTALAEDLRTDLRVNGYDDIPAGWFDVVIRQHTRTLLTVVAAQPENMATRQDHPGLIAELQARIDTAAAVVARGRAPHVSVQVSFDLARRVVAALTLSERHCEASEPAVLSNSPSDLDRLLSDPPRWHPEPTSAAQPDPSRVPAQVEEILKSELRGAFDAGHWTWPSIDAPTRQEQFERYYAAASKTEQFRRLASSLSGSSLKTIGQQAAADITAAAKRITGQSGSLPTVGALKAAWLDGFNDEHVRTPDSAWRHSYTYLSTPPGSSQSQPEGKK